MDEVSRNWVFGDRPPQGFECIVVAWGSQKGRKSWNGLGNLTHCAHKCLRGEGKHKTEKPLDLILDLVSWFSNVGEYVIDPFAGSGTTGLACKLIDRKFGGCELDPDWAFKADNRINSNLSERDEGRYNEWQKNRVEFLKTKERIKTHTTKVRGSLIAKENL